ncbi:hypothetical protein N7517_001832 [Penicillium concentricum]|uniref:Uncharacterized protein n=1 Tax=Penicillium concentricum TaxID=293559 RepID=A0A9W9VL70_9EURO|nr:uncharacterized protein N7517_001832 [Penicillium concentricum]KAJ5383921.1 hypothetical protein N7517_001832 [Penicillium concentricum]
MDVLCHVATLDSPMFKKKRHDNEVRHLDSQLAAVSHDIRESLHAKDLVIVECHRWQPKFPKT